MCSMPATSQSNHPSGLAVPEVLTADLIRTYGKQHVRRSIAAWARGLSFSLADVTNRWHREGKSEVMISFQIADEMLNTSTVTQGIADVVRGRFQLWLKL